MSDCVPSKRSLVMSVTLGEDCYLLARSTLLSSSMIEKLVQSVTGDCPERILTPFSSDVLLVFVKNVDSSWIKV